jgi:adenylate cyclase
MKRVEPEWAMVTILFVDIRGFTAFADRSTAREAVDYLNEFFAVAVPVVSAHGGHVNKLLGDGLLAVFGAPEPVPDHADRALAAASDLLAAVDSELGERCRVGIGVNSGLVLVGTIGAGDVVEDQQGLEPRGTISLRGKPEPIAVYGCAPDSVTLPGRLTRRKDRGWQH